MRVKGVRLTPEERRAKNIEYTRAWRRNNPDKVRVSKREWGAANTDKVSAANRRKHLKRAYGISPEEYDAILLSQGGRCKICRTDEPGRNGYWCVDHCHKSTAVRGILCHDCNLALGHVKDNVEILGAMIEYLEKGR